MGRFGHHPATIRAPPPEEPGAPAAPGLPKVTTPAKEFRGRKPCSARGLDHLEGQVWRSALVQVLVFRQSKTSASLGGLELGCTSGMFSHSLPKKPQSQATNEGLPDSQNHMIFYPNMCQNKDSLKPKLKRAFIWWTWGPAWGNLQHGWFPGGFRLASLSRFGLGCCFAYSIVLRQFMRHGQKIHCFTVRTPSLLVDEVSAPKSHVVLWASPPTQKKTSNKPNKKTTTSNHQTGFCLAFPEEPACFTGPEKKKHQPQVHTKNKSMCRKYGIPPPNKKTSNNIDPLTGILRVCT